MQFSLQFHGFFVAIPHDLQCKPIAFALQFDRNCRAKRPLLQSLHTQFFAQNASEYANYRSVRHLRLHAENSQKIDLAICFSFFCHSQSLSIANIVVKRCKVFVVFISFFRNRIKQKGVQNRPENDQILNTYISCSVSENVNRARKRLHHAPTASSPL